MRRKESWESFDPASAVRQRGTCYCLDTRVDELLKRRIACAGRAATFVAAKAACIHGRLACAFVRLRRPKAPLRVTFDRSLPPPPCRLGRRRRERSEHGERSKGAVRLCLPRMVTSDERKKVSGGGVAPYALTRVPPAVKARVNQRFLYIRIPSGMDTRKSLTKISQRQGTAHTV